jgi:beta-galactosidase
MGRTEAVSKGGARRRLHYSAADAREGLLVDECWSDEVGSALLTVSMIPTGIWRIHWPRLGVRFALRATVHPAARFGAGERESYPDSRRSAHVGRYQSDLTGLVVDYARPQESGHHSEFRELILSEGGSPWLKIEAIPDGRGRLPGFTLRRHTTADVAAAAHPHDLPESDRVYLWLDAAQHGLGSRACGPDVWPDHILRPEARTVTIRLTSLR